MYYVHRRQCKRFRSSIYRLETLIRSCMLHQSSVLQLNIYTYLYSLDFGLLLICYVTVIENQESVIILSLATSCKGPNVLLRKVPVSTCYYDANVRDSFWYYVFIAQVWACMPAKVTPINSSTHTKLFYFKYVFLLLPVPVLIHATPRLVAIESQFLYSSSSLGKC